jgi:H/ACA ribonucleoprotein complex subunit 4
MGARVLGPVPEQLVRARGSTSPEHGSVPSERSVEDLVERGCIVLDKPQGPSSHQVAAWVRDLLDVDQAGHGGTLDPNVSGVLPVGLDEATKVLAELKDEDKEYVGVLTLHDDVPDDRLDEGLSTFTGEIHQRPPKRSAVKRQQRTRTVHELEQVERDGRDVVIRVACEGGTYVRTLVDDLGTYLGAGAHLQELRRTRVAHLEEVQAVSLHDVQDAWEEYVETGRDDWLRDAILPQERFLDHRPVVTVRDSAVDAVCHGAPLALPGVLDISRTVDRGDRVVLETLKGEAIALAEAKVSAVQTMMLDEGIVAEPERRLMEPGTYPRGWGPGD